MPSYAWLIAFGCALRLIAAAGERYVDLKVSGSGKPGFTQIAPGSSGITFTNVLSRAEISRNQILLNGSGLAAADVNGDGRCDLYFCRMEGPNALYLNLGGWKFQEAAAAAGVACAEDFSTGAAFADIDGDQDFDLLVNGIGAGTRLFLNDGAGHFAEKTGSGLNRSGGSTSMALADVDADGDLDLYVTNYRESTIKDTGIKVLNINGRRMVRPEDRDRIEITPEGLFLEYGEADVLYLNDGQGVFRAASWTDGTFADEAGQALKRPPRDWGLAVQFRDMNGDGLPDLYVCNDFFTPDRIWLNQGAGRFRAIAQLAVRATSLGAMAVDFADFNRDGFEDFIVVDLLSREHRLRMTQREPNGQPAEAIDKMGGRPQIQRNTLFLNRGDGTYAELAQLAGVEASEWSWGVVWLDVDLDGYEDLLITTGHGYDTLDTDTAAKIDSLRGTPTQERIHMFPRLNVPNVAFRNRGDWTFEDAGDRWGFNAIGVSHGMALADLDNDGDLDLAINNLNEAAGIYRNESVAPRLAVRLRGSGANTKGIGAKIRVFGGAAPMQMQEVISGGRYLSGDEPLRAFAAGQITNNLKIEVTWPDGKRSLVADAKPNRIYQVPYQTNITQRLAAPPQKTVFRQAMQFRDTGPGVCWFDLDADGRQDLLFSAGSFYRNVDGTNFAADAKFPPGEGPIAAFRDGTKPARIAIAASNAVTIYEYKDNAFRLLQSLPFHDGSPGPLTLADVEGDGDLDLFVGGRATPGRYPEPPSSSLYFNERGSFVRDEKNSNAFEKAGLVNGAVFTDIDADGDQDLALACEWGPIQILRNSKGLFTRATTELGLAGYSGWWNGLASGDFDGDGRMDLIALNWGRNTKYERHRHHSLLAYYGEVEDKSVVLVQAAFDPAAGKVVPLQPLDVLAPVMPSVAERFRTFHQYAAAGVREILGPWMSTAHELQAKHLESMVLLNRGSRFEARHLPIEAQLSPAFGGVVADFDGDSHADAFLSQNLFDVPPETSRYDAGRGLLLLGDGRGNFKALPSQESGITLEGQQRGVAAGDYDRDGRVDLVVAQKGGVTILYHNETANPRSK